MKKEQRDKRTPVKNLPVKKRSAENKISLSKYQEPAGLAIILLLGIVIYSNSFGCSFHFDDYLRIVNNPAIRNLSDVSAWWNYYPTRPFGIFTLALNYHFSRLDVGYWHLVNLVIHLINAILTWWLARLILSSPAVSGQPVSGYKKLIPFMTALLFVSHPLATQSVTYIIQRLASLAALFYLLSLALYMKARLTGNGNRQKLFFYIASLVSALLAILTKENAFTLPFAILLTEFCFLHTGKFSVNFRDYRVWLLAAAFLAIIIFIPLKTSVGVFRPIPPMLGHLYTITPVNYLFTQFSVIVKYIQLLILPVNQTFDYDFPVAGSFFGIRTLLSFLALLSLVILSVFLYKRNRVISFGIFWFFLTLSVESGFIPINDVIYEHRTYLPSFGFFLVLSTVLCLYLWDRHRKAAIGVFVIIAGVNSYLAYERNFVWKDDLTFWNDNVAKAPGIVRPVASRGLTYLSLGQWENAIADYTRVIAIDPMQEVAYSNRGLAYYSLGRWKEAIADDSAVIALNPQNKEAYFRRGLSYGNLGHWERSVDDFSKAIALNPKSATAYFNRGLVYGNLHQWDNAVADFTKALEIDPTNTKAYSYREAILKNTGKVQ